MTVLKIFLVLCISYGVRSGELNSSQWISSQSGNLPAYYSHYNSNELKFGDSKEPHGKYKEDNNYSHYFYYANENHPKGVKNIYNRGEKKKKGKIERQSLTNDGNTFNNNNGGIIGTDGFGIPPAALITPIVTSIQNSNDDYEDDEDVDDGILSLGIGFASGILALGALGIGGVILIILSPIILILGAPFVLPFLIPLLLPFLTVIVGILLFPIPVALVPTINAIADVPAPLFGSFMNRIENTVENIGTTFDNIRGSFVNFEENDEVRGNGTRRAFYDNLIIKENCKERISCELKNWTKKSLFYNNYWLKKKSETDIEKPKLKRCQQKCSILKAALQTLSKEKQS